MTIKETILKIVGWIAACFGIFMLIVGLGMTIDSDSVHSSDGPSIALCSLIFLIPAGICLYKAKRAGRENELLVTLAQLTKSYGRVTISELAAKLEVTPSLTMKMLSMAMAKGHVSGTFDRTTDEFVTDNARPRSKGINRCPHCGFSISSVYLETDTVKCGQCGSIIN